VIAFRPHIVGRATWLILFFWISIFAVGYFAVSAIQAPNVARATTEGAARGEIVIPKSRDGHYYVDGAINATPVTFLVDTGASVVTIGPEFSKRARLAGGDPVKLDTVGGAVTGEMVPGITIIAGGIRIEGLRVAVSPSMRGEHALLGQNFLRHVAIEQRGEQLILRVAGSR